MAHDPSLYCIPFTNDCRLMSEWAVFWQAASVVVTLIVGIFGVIKILHELERLREQRKMENDAKFRAVELKKIEFFIDQHRRLFDDKDLYEVLGMLDGDLIELRDPSMWDKKRKFLTFIEEISLLVRAGQINRSIACYMFGYYARRARDGINFKIGIQLSPAHWALFYWFAKEADKYQATYPNGPDLRELPRANNLG